VAFNQINMIGIIYDAAWGFGWASLFPIIVILRGPLHPITIKSYFQPLILQKHFAEFLNIKSYIQIPTIVWNGWNDDNLPIRHFSKTKLTKINSYIPPHSLCNQILIWPNNINTQIKFISKTVESVYQGLTQLNEVNVKGR